MPKRWTRLLWCLLVAAPAASAAERVVLVHGLGRGPHSMSRLAKELTKAGYAVSNVGYASTRGELVTLADGVFDPVFAQAEPAGETVHVVTHSMGGILLRQYLHDHGVPVQLGRVVMLGPPNQGSEIVDRWGSWRLFRWINGPAGVRLGTSESAHSAPVELGAWPADVELGVIAGNRSWNPVFSAIIAGPDDGKVSVAHTHLAGEKDHVTLAASHTWLMWRRGVIDQVRAFLRDGRFADQP